MRTMRLGLVLGVLLLASAANATVITSLVGDIDGFSGGGPADTPFRSADVVDLLTLQGYTPLRDLDQPMTNFAMGWTHLFTIPDGHTITGATLRVGVYPGSGFLPTDFLGLDLNVNGSAPWGEEFGPRAVIGDTLGDLPPAFTTTEITFDLSAVLMRPGEVGSPSLFNLLPQLVDGEFNVLLADDMGVDYSILTVNTAPVPEPSTVLLLGPTLFGLGALAWRGHLRR